MKRYPGSSSDDGRYGSSVRCDLCIFAQVERVRHLVADFFKPKREGDRTGTHKAVAIEGVLLGIVVVYTCVSLRQTADGCGDDDVPRHQRDLGTEKRSSDNNTTSRRVDNECSTTPRGVYRAIFVAQG